MYKQDTQLEERSSLDRKLISFFSGFNGFGLIFLFWILTVLMLGGLSLLIIGALTVNWIAFFCGLLSLRIYFYIARINRDCLDDIKPFDG